METCLAGAAVSPDHVHMRIAIPPKYAVSQVVKYIKGKSACKRRSENPSVKQPSLSVAPE
jgi:REP element-mobilizing transposase RayT